MCFNPVTVGSRQRSEPAADRLQLDVPGANRDQLVDAGVSASQIYDSGLCTACDPVLFHSYRRDKDRAGRLVGYIRACTVEVTQHL